MRRALAIVKYVPALLCGLLIMAWMVSFFREITLGFPTASGQGSIGIENACLTYRHAKRVDVWVGILLTPADEGWSLKVQSPTPLRRKTDVWGSFNYDRSENYFRLQTAIPGLIALLLPISIGSLTRFRFPLWSYFAWTALVAAASAVYLR